MPDRSDHALALASRSRIALLTGDCEAAAQLAAQGVVNADSTRGRMDALSVQISANRRMGEAAIAQEAYGHLTTAITATGARVFGCLLSDDDHLALGGDSVRTASSSDTREIFPAAVPGVKLTNQQRLILSRLADGRTLTQIGIEQRLSYNTVKTHARGLYKLLNASSRDEAIARAYDGGLL